MLLPVGTAPSVVIANLRCQATATPQLLFQKTPLILGAYALDAHDSPIRTCKPKGMGPRQASRFGRKWVQSREAEDAAMYQRLDMMEISSTFIVLYRVEDTASPLLPSNR